MIQGEIIESIAGHIENEMLITIERTQADENKITGFPLVLSDSLVVMSKIVDFHDEGFVVIRLEDITDTDSKESSVFYEDICINEGLQKRAYENPIDDVTDFASVLRQLCTYDKFVGVQCEYEDSELFYSLGHVLGVDEGIVHFKNFDTMGVWQDETRKIPLDKVTLVAIEDHYSKMFYKYVKPLQV